jgi:oligo-1,6-glucosidase
MDSIWWKQEAIYQIYPRSFCDSNGDGIGDIPGIISKLDYLKNLGVGAIWLSPVYKSPNDDMGYDISDYYDINPEYGTLEDMRKLFKEAKKRDLKIVMDLVINHTSDEHAWFKASHDVNSPYHDFYIWKDPKVTRSGKKRPPNNWQSFFTGSAWQYCEDNGKYYLHLFTRKQPDLNYRNPVVIEEVKKIMRYWLDMGAAGFRCDVINIIYKSSFADGKNKPYKRGMEHYLSQPGAHKILKELQEEVLTPYNAFTVGETTDVDLEAAKTFTNGELSIVFPFDHTAVDYFVLPLFKRKYQPKRMIEALMKWQENIDWNAVFFENHDIPRSVSRFGDDKTYRQISAKMLATVLLTLRGTPFIFQGEEIGMTNVPFTDVKQFKDVSTINVYRLLRGAQVPHFLAWKWVNNFSRDHARTPMQWNDKQNGGFTTGEPWLLVNPNYSLINVEKELSEKQSIYAYYQKLLALKKEYSALQQGSIRFLQAPKDVFAYYRTSADHKVLVIANMGNKIRTLGFTYSGDVLLSNYQRKTDDKLDTLAPYESIVVRLN